MCVWGGNCSSCPQAEGLHPSHGPETSQCQGYWPGMPPRTHQLIPPKGQGPGELRVQGTTPGPGGLCILRGSIQVSKPNGCEFTPISACDECPVATAGIGVQNSQELQMRSKKTDTTCSKSALGCFWSTLQAQDPGDPGQQQERSSLPSLAEIMQALEPGALGPDPQQRVLGVSLGPIFMGFPCSLAGLQPSNAPECGHCW